MFDIGWSELLVIGMVALIAIGPKELPGVLRMVGQWMTKLRRMASEFQSQFQEAMREAEMADIKKEIDAIGDSTARELNKGLDPSNYTPAADDAAHSGNTENAGPAGDDAGKRSDAESAVPAAFAGISEDAGAPSSGEPVLTQADEKPAAAETVADATETSTETGDDAPSGETKPQGGRAA